MTGLHLIWFRDDLRVHDHEALRAACEAVAREGGQILAIYILPAQGTGQNNQGEVANGFLIDSLRDLDSALAGRGAHLHLRAGDPIEVFSSLHRAHKILSVNAHERRGECQQDHAVEAWSLRAGVPFRIMPQFGPPLNGETAERARVAWRRFMMRPRVDAPKIDESANVGIGRWPMTPALEAPERGGALPQKGGRKQAIKILRAGLLEIPDAQTSAAHTWHWLKPYLDLGTVSVREAWQAASSAHQYANRTGLNVQAASIGRLIEGLTTSYCGGDPRLDRHWHNRPQRASKRRLRNNKQLSFGFEVGEVNPPELKGATHIISEKRY